jgi:hypothetical protein
MSIPHQIDNRPGPPGAAPDGWAAGLSRQLLVVLTENRVSVEILNRSTARFQAVPLAAEFSKQCSNLLLQWTGLGSGSSVYVDADLNYQGSDRTLVTALTGPSHHNWRRLRLPPLAGSINDALCAALRILGSPLAPSAAQILVSQFGLSSAAAGQESEPLPGRVLAAIGQRITRPMAAAAYACSFRKPLAHKLAVLTTRAAPPRAAVLWGHSGCGRDELLVAAAHPLFEAGKTQAVYRVSGAMLAAGCLVSQEVDATFMHLLAELADEQGCLLLVQDLDLCLSGSAVSYGLLCRALDHGLRLLATVRNTALMQPMRNDPDLVRRLMAIHVRPPRRSQTLDVLQQFAGASGINVAPSAIQAAIAIADGQEAGQPAGALGLLSAALAEAAWEGRTHVSPDDLLAVLENRWPVGPGASLHRRPDEP